jgi:hypothetical protein
MYCGSVSGNHIKNNHFNGSFFTSKFLCTSIQGIHTLGLVEDISVILASSGYFLSSVFYPYVFRVSIFGF